MSEQNEAKRPWTPGPWEKSGKNVYAESWQGPMNANGCVSVGCNTDERPLSVLDANARLVAASPELYEALDALYRAVETGEPELDDAKDQAKAALKKANPG